MVWKSLSLDPSNKVFGWFNLAALVRLPHVICLFACVYHLGGSSKGIMFIPLHELHEVVTCKGLSSKIFCDLGLTVTRGVVRNEPSWTTRSNGMKPSVDGHQ